MGAMIAAAGLILALSQGSVDQRTGKTPPPQPERPPVSPWTVTLKGERACAYSKTDCPSGTIFDFEPARQSRARRSP